MGATLGAQVLESRHPTESTRTKGDRLKITTTVEEILTSRSTTPEDARPDSVFTPATTTNSIPHVRNERQRTPIAICGLAMRLPGGISNADDFWDLLVNGKDARRPIPPSRYNIYGFDGSLGGPGGIKFRHGYFLEDDLTRFDASLFSMSKTEVEEADPQQRILLELTRECLEDAGETAYRGQPVGCYVGTFGEDWLQKLNQEPNETGGYVLNGSADYMLANRISYEYDFQGPSMTIKSACSAALVALHEACAAIEIGDASSAIVAGSSLILGPTMTAIMSSTGVTSPDASCKTFDAQADGFARAEGINAVYIKRLDDALRDRNPIRAVIRGTGTNSDGRSQGVVNPRVETQEALMRKVYGDAGLDPSETAFVECHGTGTAVGDPIETTAVGNVFGERGVLIGSVKPNMGHGEASAGITGIMKAVLALEHNTLPPNIKFNTPNPKIPWTEKKLSVPTKPTPFPHGRAERISINSFGVGGSNAHVIVESLSQTLSGTRIQPPLSNSRTNGVLSPQPKLLLFSANTQASLTKQIASNQEYALRHLSDLDNIAYTRALRRERLPHKAFAIVQSGKIVHTSSAAKCSTRSAISRGITMVFTGQGSQWAGMAQQLLHTNTQFRGDMERMDRVLQGLAHPPKWSLVEELQRPPETSRVHKAELSQPLCTALQIALFHQFERLGVTPSAVVGHSSGEIAAAYAAGGISLEYAITAAYYRGFVTMGSRTDGAMAAIGLGPEDTSKYLRAGVVNACENSPQSTTISGDRKEVEEVVATIKKERPETFARMLKVDKAYHSHHMRLLAEGYLRLLRTKQPVAARGLHCTFMSSVTSKQATQSTEFGPEYWACNLCSPVRFNTAVSNLLALPDMRANVFLEVGPHSTLAGPLRQICSASSTPCMYIASQTRNNDGAVDLLVALGKLYQENIPIDFAPLFPHGRAVNNLPTYPWDHSASFWYESRLNTDWRLRKYPRHVLLGSRVPDAPDTEPLWRNLLSLEDAMWLADHKALQDIVFPFAGYVAMAGEAIRQLSGGSADAGYRLRHVVARTALVLTESKPVEITTTLVQKWLNDTDVSPWFHFTISSYNGSTWIKHAEGDAVSIQEPPPIAIRTPESLPRRLPALRFYDAFAGVGIEMGPEYQTVTDVNASATEPIAAATILNKHHSAALQPFTMHPTVIDGCMQVAYIAMSKGLCRNMQLRLPTMMEEVEIYSGASEMQARGWSAEDGSQEGTNVEVIADGHIAVRMSRIHYTPFEEETVAGLVDKHAAAHLEWVPDFDFAELESLITSPVSSRPTASMQAEMTLLCILETADKIAGLEPGQPHFEKFRGWCNMRIEQARSGTFPLIEDPASLTKLDVRERRRMIDTHYSILSMSRKSPTAIATKRLCDKSAEVFTGRADTLDILMQDNVLAEIYNEASMGFSDFVRLLSYTRPNLRILEVGAGTGGTTELILRGLVEEGGLPPYSLYTFTDVSAGFFVEAKERFSYAPNMDYRVFDISRSPSEQGLDDLARSYDLVIAANVVHATPCIKQTLGNLLPLLKADGMLLLTEICHTDQSPNYIFGHFSGWWLGEADGRVYEPGIPISRWDTELKAAGFAGVRDVMYDEEPPYQQMAAIVSQPASSSRTLEKQVFILCEENETEITRALKSHMEKSGCAVSFCSLRDQPPQNGALICCLDLEEAFVSDFTERSFHALQTFLKRLGQQKVLWLSNPVQLDCKDPRSAATVGLIRAVRSEQALSLATLEIDSNEPKFVECVLGVFEKVCRQEDSGNLSPDMEFAVKNGSVYIPRFHPFSLANAMLEHEAEAPNAAKTTKTLCVGQLGSLETLHWQDEVLPSTLPADAVEIETRAVGLNFRDVLVALGVVVADLTRQANIPLGSEASGIVRRIGSAVKDLAPGDRVIAMASHGALTTFMEVPAVRAWKIPDDMTFEAATTITVCFATTIRALLDVGRLEKGQSVLIHSACGGIGLTAIQICRMLGAEIYLTVGSPRKVKYLVETLGIPGSRIFSSRNTSFYDDVMRATSGRGVDLVLNALSGELLQASWKCVAKYGKMLEIGKRDLASYASLDMRPFLENRSYEGIDLNDYFKDRPQQARELITRFFEFYRQGMLQPIEPVTLFDAAKAEEAFRYMQGGTHIGKVVITMPQKDHDALVSLPPSRSIMFDPHATYLLVGGFGGLGKSVATWMVERGARYLTFLSRNAGRSDESKAFLSELQAMGCSTIAVAGSVENKHDVQAAIRQSRYDVKGVLQLAMVLRDEGFFDMQWSQWRDVAGPKITGTWNLHDALLSSHLDFFWIAGSLVTAAHQYGQSNYVAATMFQEAFVQYRHSLGLPASLLNICGVHGVGYIAENPLARRAVRSQGMYSVGEREFLQFVELSMLEGSSRHLEKAGASSPWSNSTQVLMGLRSELHLDDPNNRASWRRDRRMGTYHNMRSDDTGATTSETSVLKTLLGRINGDGGEAVLADKDAVDQLTREVGKKIYDFMLKADEEVDVSLTLQEMGLDSLMAIELRRWFKLVFGLTISVLEIMGAGSLHQLGGVVVAKLGEKLHTKI